ILQHFQQVRNGLGGGRSEQAEIRSGATAYFSIFIGEQRSQKRNEFRRSTAYGSGSEDGRLSQMGVRRAQGVGDRRHGLLVHHHQHVGRRRAQIVAGGHFQQVGDRGRPQSRKHLVRRIRQVSASAHRFHELRRGFAGRRPDAAKRIDRGNLHAFI